MIETKEKTWCVYKHTSPSGKVYIGITNKNPQEKRWYSNGTGYKRQKLFWRAIQKYGWDNFEHEILYTGMSKSDAANKEKELISLYDSTNPLNGYNCSTGGECSLSGVQWTEEQKEKRKKAYTGDGNPFYGKKHTQESRQKMSESQMGHEAPNKGKIPSDSTLQLWSQQRKGVPHIKTGQMNDKTKKRLSESHNFQKKIVLQFDKNNNLISEYESISMSSKATGINLSSISKCCSGQCKTAGGYIWRYKNNELVNDISYKTSIPTPVIQLSRDGVFIKEYNSISEAHNLTEIDIQSISACCKHKRLSAGGFIWRYKEDGSNQQNERTY